MKPVRVLGVVILLFGVAAMIYGCSSYKAKSDEVLAAFRFLTVGDKLFAFIPIALGLVGLILGSSMFFERGKRK